ncbi:type I-E CRISPR-associated protein Cas7/Cse4/CasC [Balneatrix alpica]|uniref:type I-E CRISPR-associated protein Cas7/Cse4/CasC n=1 Tax=Balneatrix alpica TaxID=75684 RepID=UPI00273A0819|nr:type I-E CRISPR-associated protein Cas7/Cse4/CasC [Balneatrix alpica]
MSNFINFHVLISHSPACLNRDDMNMQKDAVFGGKRRVRISSQSLKRAIRKSDYYAANLGESSIRTINLTALREQLLQQLADQYPTEIIDQTLKLLAGRNDANFNKEDKITGDAVTPWVVGEFAWFCDQVVQANTEGLDDKKLAKQLKNDVEAMRTSLQQGVDVALSGRMATSGMMSELGKVDGAMSIAHAITTHTVDSDIDWFTAVDDLQELGSAHLGTQEFSAGVFYRYASLNIAQLQENLGGVSRAKALEIAAHLAHMLATEVPNAKQRTFAAFNPADLVMVNFSDLPISLANAFEAPVKAKEGYLKPSIDALNTYWDRIAAGYGLTGAAAQFCVLEHLAPAGVTTKETLEALKAWIRNNGEG